MRYQIQDQQYNLPVAVFEHPNGWLADGQVGWNLQLTSNPAWVYARAYNPNGSESLEFMPNAPFYWLQPNMGFEPSGSQKFGLTLMPPSPCAEVLARWVVPAYRNNRQNLQLIKTQDIPDLARQVQALELQNIPTQGASVSVQYSENGQGFEEEWYACRYEFPPAYGAITQQNWGLVRVFCLRAAQGQLEPARNALWAIATSIFYNLQWQQLFQQITQQLNGQFVARIQDGYQKLQSEAQFQQQLSAFYQHQRDQQSANITSSIAHQHDINAQRSNYSAQDAWADEALSGRTAYQDPNSAEGNYYYNYNHHEYVWTDGQGQFQGTDDPNLDPNIGSDRTWTLAKKVREG